MPVLKRPAGSTSTSLKRPAASINDAIAKMRKGAEEMDGKEDPDDDSEGEDDEQGRDKSKGQKFSKMKDDLPAYVLDLIEKQSKKSASPREWKTKCINRLFVRDKNNKLVLNLSDSLFEEHRRIYNERYAKEEDHAMPESIMKGLYFGNDEGAFERAKKAGDIEEIDCNGKSLWAYTSYKRGKKTGTFEEQSLKGGKKVDQEQQRLLMDAFKSVGWKWNFQEKDMKKLENDGKIPQALIHLVQQASDSQVKLSREAMAIIKSWPGDKKDERLTKLKQGHAQCSQNLAKLSHMKEFQELPDGLSPTKSNLDGLMKGMAEHTKNYNELVECCQGVVRSIKN